MFVCTGRFGVLHLTKNAETRHTRIHTYTHFCFLFSRPQTMLYASLYFGKSALFTREECTFGTWLGHPKMLYTSLDFGKSASLCVNNALLGIFGGLKTCFLQASIWENRRRHKANNALLGIFGGLKACFLQAWNREIDANTRQIVHFSADAISQSGYF